MTTITAERKAMLRTDSKLEDIIYSVSFSSFDIDIVRTNDLVSDKNVFKAFINSEVAYSSYSAEDALGNAMAIASSRRGTGYLGECTVIINKFGTESMVNE